MLKWGALSSSSSGSSGGSGGRETDVSTGLQEALPGRQGDKDVGGGVVEATDKNSVLALLLEVGFIVGISLLQPLLPLHTLLLVLNPWWTRVSCGGGGVVGAG